MSRNIHPSIRNRGRQQEAPNPNAHFNDLFEQFIQSSTFRSVLGSFYKLCDALDIKPGTEFRHIYPQFKIKLTSWKAKSLWAKIDKRAQNREYKKGRACLNTRVFIIGCGPCGLRTAIETALLGAKTVIIEKRDRFSRNNVLHLWPFTITDLKSLGAKLFYGKFCAGSIDHIAIRQLQCMLLKTALLVGVQVYENVEFEDLIEPCSGASRNNSPLGWRAKVLPIDHPVSYFDFDVIIGADGRRNTLDGTYTGGNPFPRKEFRGKLAIAITANFVNFHSQEEASVEEISGVAFIFNQKFFQDLREKTGIDLENIVYYKDETHYFVMTAKKQSLLQKGVIIEDLADTISLLSRDNVDQEKLLEYAKEAADFSTNYKMPKLEFARNHYGQSDVAMFDFTSIYAAESASYVLDRNGHKLLMGLVGDSLLEPFWPTGSGCARGFLGAFDAAWMVRNWSSNNMTPLQVIAERETIFKLLPQVTPENLHKDHNQYSINPDSRYPNLNKKLINADQVTQLYNGGAGGATQNSIVETKTATLQTPSGPDRTPSVGTTGMFMSKLIHWCKDQVEGYDVEVKDMSTSWKSGLALCAIINRYRPDLLDFDLLNPEEVEYNNQIAFDIAEKELGIPPEMNGAEMANCDVPDRLTLTSYLTKINELLKNEPPVVRRGHVEEGSRAKRARPLAALPETVPTVEVTPSEVALPASLANHEFLVGSQKPPTSQLPAAPFSKMGKPRVSILKSFTDSITKKKKTPEPSTMGGAEHEADQGLRTREEEDSCGNRIKEADVCLDSKGKSKVSSLAANLQKQFDRQQSSGPELPTKRQAGRPTGKPPAGPSQGSGTEVCYFCNTRVYVMERLSAEGLFFHRGCLRCDYCNTLLRLGNYAFERDPIVGSCHFYCVQHMGMKKTRLTRKRSINNSLVTMTSSPAAASLTVRGGVTGGGDGPHLLPGTRERISLGPGSPTEEELPLNSPLNGFDSPRKLSTGASQAAGVKSPGFGNGDRSPMSATPERVEYSTKRVKEDEDSDMETDPRLFDSQKSDEEEESEEETSSSEEEETSSEEEESDEDEDEEEDEDRHESDVEEPNKPELASSSSTSSSSAVVFVKPSSSELLPVSLKDSTSKPEVTCSDAVVMETIEEKSSVADAERESLSSSSSQITISTPSEELSGSSSEGDDDKMEFDDEEIHGNKVASEEEPSSLPSPPFPLATKDSSSKSHPESSSTPASPNKVTTTSPSSTSPAALSPTADSASRILPSSSSSSIGKTTAKSSHSSTSSPTHKNGLSNGDSVDHLTLTGQFQNSGGKMMWKSEEIEVDMETGKEEEENSSPAESPTHYLPPKHLLSANRSKLSQLNSPSSFQQQFSHLAVKKAKDNMKRISITEEEMKKMKDFNSSEKTTTIKARDETEGSYAAEAGRKKLKADELLDGRSSSQCSSPSPSPPLPAIGIPFVDDESESESESILDKSRRDDSASEHGSPSLTKSNNNQLVSKQDNNNGGPKKPQRFSSVTSDETAPTSSSSNGVRKPESSDNFKTPTRTRNIPDNPDNPNCNNNPEKEATEEIRLLRSAKQLKLREEARLKARMKSDEEYGIKTPTTPLRFAGVVSAPAGAKEAESAASSATPSGKGNDKAEETKKKRPAPPIPTSPKSPVSPSAAKGASAKGSSSSKPEVRAKSQTPTRDNKTSAKSGKSRSSQNKRLSSRESSVDRPKRGDPSVAKRSVNEKTETPEPQPVVVVRRGKSSGGGSGEGKKGGAEGKKGGGEGKKGGGGGEGKRSVGNENENSPSGPPKEKKRISFLELFGIKNSPDHAENKAQKPTKEKADKASTKGNKKTGKKSSLAPGRFSADLTKDMNRLNLNNKKDSRVPRVANLPAAPRATLSDEFASSSDDEVNSNAGSTGSMEILNVEELERRTLRRIQKAARQQQKQQEQKRLRIAQELQRHLEEVEVKQRELEGRGVAVEMILRGEGDDGVKSEAELMQEWFNLVYEKNVLVRYESELMVRAKELELEDRHGRLQTSLREKMIIPEEEKTAEDGAEEERLLEEMLDVVEQRDALVALLEEDRVREQEEDNNLIQLMSSKGYQLSPLSYQLGDIS